MDMAENKATLSGLPHEVLLAVLRRGVLGHADWKALRLTCRQLAYGPTITCLFHSIGISRLRRDVDAFLGIASDSRLAAQVRVITWHELISDVPICAPATEPVFGPDPTDWMYGFDQDIRRTIARQVLSLDWVPTPHGKDQDSEWPSRPEILPLALIREAAVSMPGVHTLVSRPMSRDRPLTYPWETKAYPLTAQVLLSSYFSLSRSATSRRNRGLFDFLLPLAASRTQNHPIRRLYISDEDSISCLVHIGHRVHQDAFRNLVHFEVCLTEPHGPHQLAQLGQCLRAATNLQSLHICAERNLISLGTIFTPGVLEGLDLKLDSLEFKWKNLRELHITNCAFHAHTLGDLLRRQANSLKVLRFYHCQITAGLLRTIAAKSASSANLNLERLIILPGEAGDTDPGFEHLGDMNDTGSESSDSSDHFPDPLLLPYQVEEKQLVDFMNGSFGPQMTKSGSILAAQLNKVKSSCLIYTHVPIFDSSDLHSGSVTDTRARYDIVSGMYDVEEIKALDTENGDIRDLEGYSYMEGSDFNSSEKIHVVDYYTDEEEDAGGSNAEDQDPESVAGNPEDGLRWVVARNPNRDIYYWREPYDADIPVSDSASPYGEFTSRRYKTEVWRFTHHTGETAIGPDPVEYWEFWDPEAGDVAEALPVGYTMRSFINQTAKPSMIGPRFECSNEYIKAKRGTKYSLKKSGKIPWLAYDPEREEEIFGQYVYRYNWLESEGQGWEWSHPEAECYWG